MAVIDTRRGQAIAYIEFKTGVEEVFDVQVVPHARCPFLSGPSPTDDDAQAVWMVPAGAGVGGRESGVGSRGTGVRSQPLSRHSPLTTHHSLQSANDWNEYGGRLMEEAQYDAADAAFRRAIEIQPTCGAAWANLAFLTADRGDPEEGRRLYGEAYRHQPSPQLRIVQATVLPAIYRSREHVAQARERFTEEVEALVADGVRMDPTQTTTPTVFFLAYQGYNDRELMEQLGSLAPSPRSQPPARRGPRGKRIRLGFLSHVLCNHTIGQLNVGIIEQLDRHRFELIVLAAGGADDQLARRIRQAADRYIELPANVRTAPDVVAQQELDILHYPDLGMSPFTFTLAHSRLAPIQTVTWGHPVTTGLPTIDYFLSCRHAETDEADEHYSERLVRLPRLGVYAWPGRGAPGRCGGASIFNCPRATTCTAARRARSNFIRTSTRCWRASCVAIRPAWLS